ncbi:uncharacterized protein At4g37920 [Wolffia australiana]
MELTSALSSFCPTVGSLRSGHSSAPFLVVRLGIRGGVTCGCGNWTVGWISPLRRPRVVDQRRSLSRCPTSVGDITIPHDSAQELSSSQETQEHEVESAEAEGRKTDVDRLDDEKMTKVCDKLIEVFLVDKPRAADWRRLLAFSREWDHIRPHFFSRCQERADTEKDPGKRHMLLRLGRKLKEVDADVQRHNELIEVIVASNENISEIVRRRRKDFTREFFEHLHVVAESYYEDPAKQNALAATGNACLAAVEADDSASESIEAINAAELKFQDILNSPTLDVACRKIDSLAEKKELDSALMLMLTKAWSSAKESNMMKDEVKDILYHLYMTARGNLQRLVPKEIRIVKYLISIEDPEEQMSALRDAFTPGDEIEGKDIDALYTTPEKLFTWIRSVLDAYHFSREGTLVREARDLMNPKVIQKLETLKIVLEKNFL